VDLVDFNENVEYDTFVLFFCSYLLILWLIICIWVGVDAWKRFDSKVLALVFFLLTFILNFPVLIFYFVIRPDAKYEEYQDWEAQGVNVPLVNFTGKKGVEMVLELRMNPANLVEAQRDMKVDVSWESNKQDLKLQPKSKEEIPPRANKRILNKFSSLGGLVRKKVFRFKEISADYTARKKKTEKEPQKQESQKQEPQKQQEQESKAKKKAKSKKKKK